MFRQSSEGRFYRIVLRGMVSLILATNVFAQTSEQRLNIRKLIDLAKREGRSEISVPIQIFPNYAVAESLEQVLRTQTPLLVQIDQKTSCLTENESAIETWYQARVVETSAG